ncbi:hypothetical protein [Posidoniimonas polymericola]|nr:hypothetical protein [Posidoniimonas polymericola]
MLLLAAVLLSVGCREKGIRTEYGTRTGYGARSVNGTTVLGQMFEDAGHRVRSWRLMSPSLAKADVIVYFPSESQPLSTDAVAWLDDWLRYSYDDDTYELQEKTLIVVGRAYSAEEFYWRETQPRAPAGLKTEYAAKLRKAQLDGPLGSGTGGKGTVGDWYDLTAPGTTSKVTTLTGPWSIGVDASKAAIEQSGTVFPNKSLDVLLADGAGHPLVSELIYSEDDEWSSDGSSVLVIENGSFLLNASVVNHEHRKLAGRVVDYAGAPEKDVVFLESDASPTISDTDPNQNPPTGFELFRIWPIGAVLAQAAALGIVFALAQFPIFGVPRRLERPALTDFSKHVTALSRLLSATRDRAFASGLVRKYFTERRQ